MTNEFKYKLDFYYQQALMYLLTLMLYAGVRGSLIENNFTLVMKDPILYIIAFFVVLAFLMLLLNRIRNRKMVITEHAIQFQHRFGKREVAFHEIEWMHIGNERSVRTAGRMQVIIIKTTQRRRMLRIRIGRYEREKELLIAMEKIAAKVPRGEHRRFRFKRKK